MTENATLRKLQNEYIWKQRFSVYKRETKCFVWQSDCVSLQTYNPVPKKWGRCVTHNDFKHNNRRLEMHDEFHSQIRPELIRSGGRTKKNQKSGPTTQWAVNQNCLKLSSENLTTKPPFSKEIKHKLRNRNDSKSSAALSEEESSFFFGPALKYVAGPTINQLIRITWERRRKDGRQEKQEKNKCDQ